MQKINLATPAYRNVFSGAYVSSLYKLIYAGMRRDLAIAHTTIDYADIVAARNWLLTSFYYGKPDCTHLLFADDDMGFEAALIFDMLAASQGVVGAMIPERRLTKGQQKFVGAPHPSGERAGPGFIRVSHCGTGIMLISRQAIDTMIERVPSIVAPASACQVPHKNPFPHFLTAFDRLNVNGRPISEDYAFCRRWTHGCGEKIFAATRHRIAHVGSQTFEAQYES